ncbi:G2-specific serine/threonine protein kinase [Mycoblastus sanguinarius]|nr:G2-specific serine/threonine protein kinase [Mycoblastus sanguinarius]
MAASTESEKYEVLETIGRGSFGTIRKVKRLSDGHILCRKEINYIKMSQKEREQLHAEFSILNSLKHPNIVGYYHREHLKSTQELYLYMEYCGGGDLSKEIQKLRDRNQLADEEYVWSIFAQLVAALYRCHYGVDAPEVGKNVMGPDNALKRLGLKGKNQVMILHRDLKPENVFLGADNSVKLGDFGLSKLMQSHDFASTYVGTPFYMSPEICAAERYTLHSDIWSLGCVMYELCARTQPFNAKTHFHLIQKIKEGRLDPLPSLYSPELQNVIKSCLNVNPLKRPDTASLLNLPAVRLIRKEREVVELGRILRTKEQQTMMKAQETEAKASSIESEKQRMRAALESTIRREWEVKARLEIDRQVQMEKERLQKLFETEVRARVEAEVQQHMRSPNAPKEVTQTTPDNIQYSSVSTSAETDFPSSTDLSSLSIDSPPMVESQTPPKKKSRTPFTRARTQFDSPMDVQMVDPSPMSIACLSLSPRRTAAANASSIPNSKNIFAAATAQKSRLPPKISSPRTSIIIEDEEDSLPDLPSPTRPPSGLPDPFKAPRRPGLLRQKTAPMNRLQSHPQPTLFPPAAADRPSRVPSPPSPRHSGFSPVRKAPPKPPTSGTENEMFKAVMQRNLLGQNGGGRTLVELAQARAGGISQAQKVEKGVGEEARKENTKSSGEVPIWDPERDEMPSPFLVRGGKGLRRL